MAQTTVAGGFIDADLVSAQTALTSGLVSTDELIISDAGVLKRMDVSVLEDYIVTNLGDNNIDVAQSSHGFAVGDVIRMTTTNNTYAKALADTAPNAEVIGIVIDVTDSNNFTYATSGEITVAAAVPNSTTAGDIVYLSTSSAGGTQTTEPSATDQISKPIAIITEANNKMVLIPFRGEIISGGASSFAPVDATYVTLGVNGTLSGERVLTGGSGITLTDAGANGAATISVTSLGITGAMMAANTITGDKIAVGSDTQGDILYYNGTDYVRLAADNGKYLRSNGNSSNPSWETASGTTINTNADNRVITGSGTANTLNGESDLTFDGSTLLFSGAAENTIKVSTTTGTAPANIIAQGTQGGTGNGGANLILGEGDLDGTAGDRAYRFSYLSNNDYFRFGSVQSGDIFRVADGETKVDFQGEVRMMSTNKLHFGDGTDTYLYQKADDQFALYVGNRHMMQSRAGGFFIGWDTGTNTGSWENAALPNAPSNPHLNGLHIHGGSGDRMHLALSSSDTIVSGSGHGMTSEAANGIFGSLEKVNPTCGGMMINGWLRTGEKVALQLRAMVTDEQTSQNATATCPLLVNVYKASGTGVQSISTSGALFGVSNANNNVKFMSHANGNIYTDGVLSHNAWDEYNDAELVRALDHLNPTMKGYVENKWDEYITYNEETLVEMGILGDTVANRGLLNVTGLQRLHNGAIWQLYSSLKDQQEEIKSLKEQLVALQAGD